MHLRSIGTPPEHHGGAKKPTVLLRLRGLCGGGSLPIAKKTFPRRRFSSDEFTRPSRRIPGHATGRGVGSECGIGSLGRTQP